MNNEIKEIERILATSGKYITYAERCYVLDYITNLQTIEQQYSALLSENAELENKITNLQQENERLKNIINENTILVQDENGNYQECDIDVIKMYNDMQNDIDELVIQKARLQEELKDYKQERENLFKTTHDLQKEIKRLENKLSQSIKWSERRTMEWLDYKSRCEKAIKYVNNHKIEWADHKFKKFNVMVEFNEYANPQALLDILGGENNV